MMNDIHQYVAAIVLAAGLSSRMGENKLLLPWQKKTIIQQVVDQVAATEIAEIIIVTGRDKKR